MTINEGGRVFRDDTAPDGRNWTKTVAAGRGTPLIEIPEIGRIL